MPRVAVINASAVILGDVFTPNLLTPSTFEKFLKGQQPRGITTNVVTQLEYPSREVVITLEEKKFQAVKRTPRRGDLQLLADLTLFFAKANPLVKLTAAGLNFAGFAGYPANTGNGGEQRFISRYVGHDALKQLVGNAPESASLQSAYQHQDTLCHLTMRSDAILGGKAGVALDLNVHRDLSGKRARLALAEHLGAFPFWWDYFARVTKTLSKQLEKH